MSHTRTQSEFCQIGDHGEVTFLDPNHPCAHSHDSEETYPVYPIYVEGRAGALYDGLRPLMCGGKLHNGTLNGKCFKLTYDKYNHMAWMEMPTMHFNRYGFSMTALKDWKHDTTAILAAGIHVQIAIYHCSFDLLCLRSRTLEKHQNTQFALTEKLVTIEI